MPVESFGRFGDTVAFGLNHAHNHIRYNTLAEVLEMA